MQEGERIQQGSFAASRERASEIKKKSTKPQALLDANKGKTSDPHWPKITSLGPRFEFWGERPSKEGGKNVTPREEA